MDSGKFEKNAGTDTIEAIDGKIRMGGEILARVSYIILIANTKFGGYCSQATSRPRITQIDWKHCRRPLMAAALQRGSIKVPLGDDEL